MNRGTLTQLFFTTVDRHGTLPAAFRSKVGGAWQSVTHREALERVEAISIGLRELGIAPGDKVAIVSENRPEWALADYACLCARAADVPIYPTLTPKQTEYILRDSESVAVFCSTTAQIDKVLRTGEGRDVRLTAPVPLHWVYVTAWATADGIVQFREDIYDRDGLGAYATRADPIVPVGAR